VKSILPFRALLALLLLATVSAHAADKAKAKAKPVEKPAPVAPAPVPVVPVTPVNPALPVLTGPLVWRGDHATARGFMTDLAKQYEKDKKLKLSLSPFSTLSGLDAVTAGTADFAGSARPAFAKRTEEDGLTFIPVAWDAVVLITHPSNPVSSVNLKDVWRLYYGRTTNWKELGGRDAAINMYAVAGPLDGVEYSLRQMVFQRGDQPVAVPRLYLNATKLEEGISIDPVGLGATTLSAVADNKKVKILGIEGVGPSLANTGNGSYPLYTPVYLVLREDGPRAAQVKAFIAWLDSPAAKNVMIKHELLPYNDGAALLPKDSERLAMIEARVNETPVAAPNATVAAQSRIAPTSPTTVAAKERQAEANDRRDASKQAEADAKDARPAPKADAKTADAKAKAKKSGGGD
jgi:phosphate transport system substrate-binding protein